MEHVFDWLLNRLSENLRVVKEAPEAIIVLAILIGVVVYFVIDKFHSERFEVLNARLASQSDQIQEYRTKLQGASPDEAAKQIAILKDQLNYLVPPLTSKQTDLLRLLAKYQDRFGTNKLIVARSEGGLFFDDNTEKGKNINLIIELYGNKEPQTVILFDGLMESMPPYYLQMLPEMRLDSPFVVSVTEAGRNWLKAH